MSLANPWALSGLAAVAVPIAVHLLARHRGPRTGFPTLRFLASDRLVSIRRYHLSDIPLMLVRIAAIVSAVLALSGPRWAMRSPVAGMSGPARAIVIDTSASMSRRGADGRSLQETARTRAAESRHTSSAETTIESADLPAAIAGAAAWLHAQRDPRELIVVSDFQNGSMTASDLRVVPASAGIHLLPISAVSAPLAIGPAAWRNDANGKLRQVTPRMQLAANTIVTWVSGPDLSAEPTRTFDLDPMLAFVASAAETPHALEALRAVMGNGASLGSSERPVAMIFAGAPSHGVTWDAASSMDQPWMADVAGALSRDDELIAAAGGLRATRKVDLRDALTPVLTDSTGQPLIIAAAGEVGQAHRLLLFVETDPGTLASALAMREVLRATTAEAPIAELEPRAIDASTLAGWERAPAPGAARPDAPAEPAGRWIWLVVLAWLALETWLRRDSANDTEVEVAHGRVA